MRARSVDRAILTAAVLGSLVLVNALSVRSFARLDLTRDHRFTLSRATRETLEGLEDPVTVRAYFTADLPPPFSTNARYVRDLLEEYHSASGGRLVYELVDPLSEETAADREKKKNVKRDIFGRAIREQTSVEREMQSLGIPPVQVQVNEEDRVEVKRAYMGIAIHYHDETEVIPMVRETDGLEYDLTTLIRKLTRKHTPKIAILKGHDGPDPTKDLSQARGLMSELYEVVELDLSDGKTEVPDDVDAILVIGPRTPLSADERRKIEAFVARGGSVAFLLDAIKPDLSTLQAEDADHGLGDLIEAYGVEIEPGLVVDAECAMINITQQRGFMRISQPVRYPLMPQPKSLDPRHPLTHGLSQVAFPFMSPLRVVAPADGPVKAEVLVRSSARSWVQKPPYDLNPLQRWTAPAAEAGPRDLVVALSGRFPSPDAAGDEKEGGAEQRGTEKAAATSEPARVLVIGGSSFVTDRFLAPGNKALLLNLLDWLVLDDALLEVRTRGLEAAPLEELEPARKVFVRYANVLGLPLAFVGLGLVRWRARERRRRRVRL